MVISMVTKNIEFDEKAIKDVEKKIKVRILGFKEPSDILASDLDRPKYEVDARERYVKLGYITE